MKSIGTKVVYNNHILIKKSKTCWYDVDANGKMKGYYKTLAIAKKKIDKE